MSDQQKRYASIYGALRPIRPDQYLVELIIERRAKKKGIKLPQRFWKNHNVQYAYWRNIFNIETKYAKVLFDKYDPECVIDAFKSHECECVLSAANKKLDTVAQAFQARKNIIDSTKTVVNIITVSTDILPRKPSGKLNKLSKLKYE